MTDTELKLVLPHFVAIFLVVTFWRSWQDKKFLRTAAVEYAFVNRLARAAHLFSVLLILFSLMTLLHAYSPALYFFLLPIDLLNEPLINGIGLVLLRIALVWVVIARFFLTRAVERFHQTQNLAPFLRAKRSHLFGMLLMFTGMLVTLTNVAAIVLCHLAFVIFRNCNEDRHKA